MKKIKFKLASASQQIEKDESVYDPFRDGVTQSRIKTWRECPTKARIYNMGIVSAYDSDSIVFGSVFHEGLDIAQNLIKNDVVKNEFDIIRKMDFIVNNIEKTFAPIIKSCNANQRQVYEDSISITEIMLANYFEAWKTDFFGDTKKRFVFIEEAFRIEGLFSLPIQGKFDSAYDDAYDDLWLMENKTKGAFNEENIALWVERDFQINKYLIALEHLTGRVPKGVTYNIVRRPMLRRGAKESRQDFLNRIDQDVKKRMSHYFVRLEVSISKELRKEFKRKLGLEIDRYKQWVESNPKDDQEYTHNCINMYGACKYLRFCQSGKTDFEGLTTLAYQNPELR